MIDVMTGGTTDETTDEIPEHKEALEEDLTESNEPNELKEYQRETGARGEVEKSMFNDLERCV
jgi:hypothetical protein